MNSHARSSAVAALAATASLVMAPVVARADGSGTGTDEAIGFTAEAPRTAADVSWRESPGVMSRGDRRGQAREADQGEEPEEPEDECPTELWTIPIEIKGPACILLLGKPADEGAE
jgi:hypothetical protein